MRLPLFLTLSLYFQSVNSNYTYFNRTKNLSKKCLSKIYQHLPGNLVNIEINARPSLPIPIFSLKLDSDRLESFLQSMKWKANGIIIHYNDIDELNTTINIFAESEHFNSRGQYIIHLNSRSEVDQVAKLLANADLYRSIMLYKNDGFEIYVINYEASKCGTEITATLLDKCKAGKFLRKKPLFKPNMKKAYENCPLYVIWGDFPPYVTYINDSLPGGLFVKFLNIFGEKTNFKIIYREYDSVYFEEIQDGYTFNAMKETFDDGYAEIFIGTVNQLPIAFFETTNSIYDNNLMWLVPKPKAIPFFKTILKMFSIHVWIIIFTCLCIAVTLFQLFIYKTIDQKNYSISKSFLHIYGVVLGFSAGNLPKNFAVRFYLSALLFTGMIITALVQGKFFNIISSPQHEASITNAEQLVNSDVPIVFGDGVSLLFINTGPVNERVLQQHKSSNLSFFRTVNEAINKLNFATITDNGALILRPDARKKMNIFDVAVFQMCFLMKKHHVLFDVFNFGMQRQVESGFMEKFVDDLKTEYSLKLIRDESKNFEKLSLKHTGGVFMVMLFGYAVALIAFIYEHIHQSITNYMNNRRRTFTL